MSVIGMDDSIMVDVEKLSVDKIDMKIIPVSTDAQALMIVNNEGYVQAGIITNQITLLLKEIDATFDPIISKAFQSHKEAVAQKKKKAEPLELAKKIIKSKIIGYQEAEEKKRREEEARLRAELQKQEEERKLAEALQAEAEGNKEVADAIMEEEIKAVPIVLPKSTPKIQVTVREIWKFRIIDKSKIPPEYLMPDEVKIGQIVRALKKQTTIGGIEVYSEKV